MCLMPLTCGTAEPGFFTGRVPSFPPTLAEIRVCKMGRGGGGQGVTQLQLTAAQDCGGMLGCGQ